MLCEGEGLHVRDTCFVKEGLVVGSRDLHGECDGMGIKAFVGHREQQFKDIFRLNTISHNIKMCKGTGLCK